MQRNTLQYKAF